VSDYPLETNKADTPRYKLLNDRLPQRNTKTCSWNTRRCRHHVGGMNDSLWMLICVRYDLKTASRLYVLEPHKAAVSSVTFSPDGRRLVTVSLGEGCVTVWKVGSSLSGFFNVGGPPRQGAGKGIPFKRIEFKRADEGEGAFRIHWYWGSC